MADNPISRNKPGPMVIGVGPNGRLTINGEELAQHDPRLWGRAGRNITQEMERYGSHNGRNWDSRYYHASGTDEGSEAQSYGAQPTFSMNPDSADRLNGRVQLAQAGVGGWSEVIDPSKVEFDPEFGLVTKPENIRRMDPSNDRYDQALMIAATAGIVGPVAMHAMSAMGAPAAAGGAEGAAGAAGAGGGGGAGSAGFTFEALPQIAQPGAMNAMAPAFSLPAEAGGLAGLGAASGGGGGGAGGALTASVPGDLAVGGGSGMAGSAPLVDMPAIQAAGGSGAGAGGLVNSLGGWQNIARTGLGLASLGASSGGGGGGGGGGSGDAESIIDQMARHNRVDQNTPIGSRRWSQGADGRWTVNDTMSPAEQANFEQVQQMNSGVTGMARQRLADMLANMAKPRPRYDRPLGT